MRCRRCCGLVVVESTAPGEINEMAAEMRGWRCLNCGAMVDVRMLKMKAASRNQALEAGPAISRDVVRVENTCSRIFSSMPSQKGPRRRLSKRVGKMLDGVGFVGGDNR